LWIIPVAVIALSTLRSSASFLADVALARSRADQFAQPAPGKCLTASAWRNSISTANSLPPALADAIVFEATNGAVLLLQSITTLAEDSLSLLALVCYLL